MFQRQSPCPFVVVIFSRLQAVQEAIALQEQDDLVDNGADALLLDVHNQVGLLGSLIGVVDTSESLNLTGASSLVDATAVSLLAVLERSVDVDQEERTRLLDELASLLAGGIEGSNGSSDDGGTSLGELRGNVRNALDVEVTVSLAEAELGGELRANSLSQKHGDGTATTLVEGSLQSTGDLVLAAVLETGHEDGETLLAGQRVLLTKNLDDLRVREPSRNLLTSAETVAKLGTGNVHGAGTLRDLVGGHVLVVIWDVDHLLEFDHLDAKLLLVLLDKFLSIVRAVVVLAVLVLTGTSVVTADNEVGRTVVLTDNGVPQSLTRTTHAHGQGQQSQSSHTVGVSRQKSLVDTDTGEMVNVTGLGHANDGVDEHVGLLGSGSADRQLTVSTVHGVTGLESDNLLPAELVEMRAQLRGSEAKLEEIIVLESGNSLELATNVEVLGGAEEVLDTRVGVVVAAEDVLGLVDPVKNGVSDL